MNNISNRKKHFLKKPKSILVEDVLYYEGMAESLKRQTHELQKQIIEVRQMLSLRVSQRNAAAAALKQLVGLVELS